MVYFCEPMHAHSCTICHPPSYVYVLRLHVDYTSYVQICLPVRLLMRYRFFTMHVENVAITTLSIITCSRAVSYNATCGLVFTCNYNGAPKHCFVNAGGMHAFSMAKNHVNTT